MFCKRCGKQNQKNSKFCQYCGEDISYEFQEPPQEEKTNDAQIILLSIASIVLAFIPLHSYILFASLVTGFISIYLINRRKNNNIKNLKLFLILSLSGSALSAFWLIVISIVNKS